MLCLYVSSVLRANKRQNIVTWLNICPRACQISCRLPVSECIHATVAFFCSATCQTILRIGETHVKTRNVKLMFDMSSPQVIHFLLRDCHSATALQFPGGYYIVNPRVHAIAAQLDLCRSLLHFLPDPAECPSLKLWDPVWHPMASHRQGNSSTDLGVLCWLGHYVAWVPWADLGREENGDELRTDKTNSDQHLMIISWSRVTAMPLGWTLKTVFASGLHISIYCAIYLPTYTVYLFAISLSIGFASFMFVCLFHCILLHLNWCIYQIRYGNCEIYNQIHPCLDMSLLSLHSIPTHWSTYRSTYVDLHALLNSSVASWPLIQAQGSFSQGRSNQPNTADYRSFHVGEVSI